MPHSIWHFVQNPSLPSGPQIESTSRYAIKHRSWPNPFHNSVKNISVLACEDTWQAKVEMYFQGFGNWFWSSLVPSPVELTRKFVAGSYKCGFYHLPGTASPIDIIWRDGKTSQVFMEIASPITTALFYIWAGSTAFEFLNTWSSLIHAQQMCDVTGAECLLSNGGAPIGGGTHHELGDCALYSVIYDPRDRYPELGGGPADDFDSNFSATAVGQVVVASAQLNNFNIWIYAGSDFQKQSLGSLSPGSVHSFSVTGSGNIQAQQAVVVRFECDVVGDTIIPAQVQVNRFTTSFGAPKDPEPPGSLFDYTPKPYMCGTLYERVYGGTLG